MSRHSRNHYIKVIGYSLAFLAFLTFILTVIEKVRSGHGLDTYMTGEGVIFNYIGALVVLVILTVSLLIGLAFRAWNGPSTKEMIQKKNSRNKLRRKG